MVTKIYNRFHLPLFLKTHCLHLSYLRTLLKFSHEVERGACSNYVSRPTTIDLGGLHWQLAA